MRNVFLAALLLVSLTAFAEVTVKDGSITANIQSESLRSVFNQIGTQTGVQVSIDDAAANDMVYANFQNLPVGAAVRKLLEGTDVNFAVLADADGKPTAIFISKSSNPGAPPKKLDTRPVTSPGRGVVQPISPPPQIPVPQPNAQPGAAGRNPAADQKQPVMPPTAGTMVPTGGSFTAPPPQQPGDQMNRQNDRPLIKNDPNVDEEDEGDDDDE
jgi:hypothetical protein